MTSDRRPRGPALDRRKRRRVDLPKLGAQFLDGSLADLLPGHNPGLSHAEQHLPAALVQEGAHRHGRLTARSSRLLELQRLGFAGCSEGRYVLMPQDCLHASCPLLFIVSRPDYAAAPICLNREETSNWALTSSLTELSSDCHKAFASRAHTVLASSCVLFTSSISMSACSESC